MSITETTTRLDYRSLQNKKRDWLIDALVLGGKALEAKEARIKELEDQKDGAYLERNTCVATMARMALMLGYKAVRTKTAIEGWSEDWHGCIYIEFPTFQSSWHFHDSQAHLFEFVPEEGNQWDGHTTEEKYRNLREWIKGGQNA